MRFAVIADTHGNVLALEAVLEDIARRGVGATFDLGDCVSGPLWPAETFELLQRLQLPTVRGNHDRALADGLATLGASDAYAVSQLSGESIRVLAGLPQIMTPLPGVLACHGTPEHDSVYLLDRVADGVLALAPAQQIERLLGATSEPLILCGHSHQQRIVQIGARMAVNPGSVGCPAYSDDGASAGSSLVINPGSVGCPAASIDTTPAHVSEAGTPHARYAVLDNASGAWSVELIAIAYDWNRAAERALLNDRADWAYALRTGRAR
jgi:predicted phosphodiesterase